jgi:hypothetical protein
MGGAGITARIRSPGETSSPSVTIAMILALKRGPASPPCRRFFNPDLKRSMRTQGVLRLVSSSVAEAPSWSNVPSGRHSRSSPTVVMFSPSSPGRTSNPEVWSPSNSSLGMRWTCRRLGASDVDRRWTRRPPRHSGQNAVREVGILTQARRQMAGSIGRS